MAKRAIIMAVSLVLTWGTAVKAQKIKTCCWGNSDIHGQVILTALGNVVTNRPGYEVVLILRELVQQCFPPSGSNPKTETGQPHNPGASVSEGGAVDPTAVTKNGKFIADIVFTDGEIKDAALGGGSLCKVNWIEGDLVATDLQGFGTVFECEGFPPGAENDPRVAGCPIADQIGQQLCAPTGQPLFQPVADFDYITKTICDDPTVPCPDEPVEFPNEGCPIM